MAAFTEIVKLIKQNYSVQWTQVELALTRELAKRTSEGRVGKWTALCHNVEKELKEKINLPHFRINFLLLQLRLMRKWLEGRTKQLGQRR